MVWVYLKVCYVFFEIRMFGWKLLELMIECEVFVVVVLVFGVLFDVVWEVCLFGVRVEMMMLEEFDLVECIFVCGCI